MSENRLPDYLDHIQQAATDACSFVDGMAKDDFLADRQAHADGRHHEHLTLPPETVSHAE
jgi:uncharacterized protein with HEPN domain